MATMFGVQPDHVVSDRQGNVLEDIPLELYASRADATSRTGMVASVSTNFYGLWPYADVEDRSVLFVRDPSGRVWAVGAEPDATGPSDGLIVVDNGDGTFTATGTPVVDNGDGTYTATGTEAIDNGDGTLTLAA